MASLGLNELSNSECYKHKKVDLDIKVNVFFALLFAYMMALVI